MELLEEIHTESQALLGTPSDVVQSGLKQASGRVLCGLAAAPLSLWCLEQTPRML